MTLGEKLKNLRKQNKLSLGKLSELSGVGKTPLWSIEKDTTNPSLSILEKLANTYHIPVGELVSEDYLVVNTSDKIMNIVQSLNESDQEKVLKVLEILFR